MQQSKSKLAASIATALPVHPDWSQASPATVRLAQVGGEKADLSAVLFAVDFRLDANTPVQHLMFRPVPLEQAPPAPVIQAAKEPNATQLSHLRLLPIEWLLSWCCCRSRKWQ